jgi:hypothetical protein
VLAQVRAVGAAVAQVETLDAKVKDAAVRGSNAEAVDLGGGRSIGRDDDACRLERFACWRRRRGRGACTGRQNQGERQAED